LGAEVGYANYFSWGYLSANFEYGTFLRNRAAEQTAYIFELNYFTNLLKIGGWRIRQFLKPQLTFGKNRLPFFADQITLNEIIDLLKKFSGNNLDVIYGFHRSGDVLHSKASIDKFTKFLGYSPNYRIRKSLEIAYKWYLESQIKK
jgi:hypothetical protein